MPQEEQLNHTFKHSWQDVFLASWKKYPSPKRPEVLSVDIIEKKFNPEENTLKTKRLMILESTLPKWLNSMFGLGNRAVFLEESTIDLKNKTMTLASQNVTFDSLIKMEETCTYTIDKENENWTNLKQVAKATAYTFTLASTIENLIVSKFKTNAAQGREIMEAAIDLVQTEQLNAQRSLVEQGFLPADMLPNTN
jgi:hypothetical protein